MGAIQNSLNQILASTLGAGFVVTQSPGVKRMVEDRETLNRLRREGEYKSDVYKTAQKESEEFKASLSPEAKKQLADVIETQDIELQKLGLEEAQAAENYAVEMAKQGKQIGSSTGVQVLATKTAKSQIQQQLLQSQKEAIESKRGVKNAVKQRRSFLEAMKNEKVSFGKGDTTFGELPTKLQKQIASKYSKSERKKVMDEYYGKE